MIFISIFLHFFNPHIGRNLFLRSPLPASCSIQFVFNFFIFYSNTTELQTIIIIILVDRKKYLRNQNTTIGQPIHNRHITSSTMSDGQTTAFRRFLFGVGSVFLPGQQPNLMDGQQKKKSTFICSRCRNHVGDTRL